MYYGSKRGPRSGVKIVCVEFLLASGIDEDCEASSEAGWTITAAPRVRSGSICIWDTVYLYAVYFTGHVFRVYTPYIRLIYGYWYQYE